MSRKYAQPEIERRWLVSADVGALIAGAPFSDIEDRYLSGTRLRLRAISSPGASVEWKLCKKYPKAAGELFEYITNVYLDEGEFAALTALPGTMARKRRYRLAVGCLDVYTHPGTQTVFEVEFATEAQASSFVPPPFAGREITGDESQSGAALARATT